MAWSRLEFLLSRELRRSKAAGLGDRSRLTLLTGTDLRLVGTAYPHWLNLP